jgi:hypothetical protein
MSSFNPKFKDLLAEKPDITIIGLYWAGFWRLYVIILGVCFGLAVLGALFGNN